jgi:hypothetical protein
MPKIFGVANIILLDTGTEPLKSHKTGTVLEKPGKNGVLNSR